MDPMGTGVPSLKLTANAPETTYSNGLKIRFTGMKFHEFTTRDFRPKNSVLGCPAGSDRNDRDRKLVYFTYFCGTYNIYL